MQEQDIAYLC